MQTPQCLWIVCALAFAPGVACLADDTVADTSIDPEGRPSDPASPMSPPVDAPFEPGPVTTEGIGPDGGPDVSLWDAIRSDGAGDVAEAGADAPATDTSGAACGGHQQPCCPGNRCGVPGDDGCCIKGVCVGKTRVCGIIEAACFSGSCGGLCGAVGQKCCPDDICTAPDTVCDDSTGVCVAAP